MFTRDPRQARIDTLIGKAATVHGDVDFRGGLHLDGRVEGGVRSDEARDSTLSVSETTRIGFSRQRVRSFWKWLAVAALPPFPRKYTVAPRRWASSRASMNFAIWPRSSLARISLR